MSPGPRFHQDAIAWPECCSGAGQGPHRHRARDRWHQRYRPTSCVGPGSAVGRLPRPRPAPGEHGFLADPGLILPPNFYRGVGREPGSDLPQPGGEVFFKILDGKLVLPLVAWSRRYLAIPQRPQFTAHRRLINRNAELFEYPMRQVLSAPTHDTVDRRNRSALNKPSERLSLPVIELGPACLSPCRQSDHPAPWR